MKRILRATAFLLAFSFWASGARSGELLTKETRVQSVEILGDTAVMHYEDAGWITTTTGTVAEGGFPQVISLGDTIQADGRKIVASIIEVTVILKDYSGWGMDLKAGDTSCLIVESEADIPSDESMDRLWLHAERCRPIN